MRGAPRLLRFAKAVTIICAGFFWMTGMECRPGCGACCIAPSISSAIPGMPNGKPAGVRCLHLTDANYCGLFGQPNRPAVCAAFSADQSVCGESREEAIRVLGWLEQATA